jgi:putative ABC transport system permease protein
VVGPLVLVWRLAIRDIRRRWVQSVLLVVMITATTTTLTVGITLRHVSQSPFAHTRVATRGPDVVAAVGSEPGSKVPPARRFAPLLHASGVRATAGPFPVAYVHLTTSHVDVPVQAQGRTSRPATIDRPKVVAGGWVRAGGVVLERGLASTLGLKVGDIIRLAGRPFAVTGIAVSTGQPFFPAQVPGVVWLPSSEVKQLTRATQPLGYVLDVRLDNPASVYGFLSSSAINTFARQTTRAHELFQITPWPFIRHDDYKVIALDQKVLFVGSWLLAILAISSIAVLVGGRMAEQSRRVGLLKAVGATPSWVATILLAESLLLALGGAILGLVAGELIAPSLATSGQGLLGSPSSTHLAASEAALILAVVALVAAAATIVPAIRGARTSTIRALTEPVDPRPRWRWLIAISGALPAPLLLAVRLVARRSRRTLLTIAGLVIAVATVVTAIAVEHDLQVTEPHAASVGPIAHSAATSQANHVLILLSVILVILAAITATFTAWATVVDTRRSTALARALGATPWQVSAGLTTAQLVPAFAAACIGIPAGLFLYSAAGGHLTEARPPILWLLAVIPLTLLAVAIATAVPARVSAGRPVAEVLRAE